MDHLRTLQTDELRPYLVRLGRRLRLRDGWLSAQRSLWIACLAAAAIQLASRVWPIAYLWVWTLAPLALWLLAVIGVTLFRPLPLMRVARRVDDELGLKERLATAMALEEAVGHACSVTQVRSTAFRPALVALQRQDALSVAQRVDPRRALPLPWLQRPLLIAALLIAAVVTLVVLPNRMDVILEERAAIAQAAEEQARRIEELQEEIERAQELTPQEREELLRRLAELARQLRDNPGDREEALADLSRVQGALQQKLDPNADARQAALEGLAAQLQALAGSKSGNGADPKTTTRPSDHSTKMQALAEKLAEMSEAERQASAQSLAQMAARAAQVGELDLAQALATLAQAAQSGDSQAASEAAQSVANAMEQAQVEMASQAALQRVLAQLQQSRHAMTQAGQSQSAKAAAQVPGSGQGGDRGQGQSQGQGQGQSQGQGQGQGQGGGQGGQGTKADVLPPGTGTGSAGRPQGEGPSAGVGELDQQIYVPWERLQGSGEEFFIPGQDTGQGETQVRERKDPLPGAPGQALVPYHEVYYHYLDTANRAMEQSYIPSGLKDYVREYFSRLEP